MSADGANRQRPTAEHITPERGEQLRSLLSDAIRGQNPLRWALEVYSHMRATAEERRAPELATWPDPPSMAGNGNLQLLEAARKADLKSTCTVRLRASMRAESIFRQHGEQGPAQNLAAYHRDHWRIAHVSDDYSERERQIADALKAKYGR